MDEQIDKWMIDQPPPCAQHVQCVQAGHTVQRSTGRRPWCDSQRDTQSAGVWANAQSATEKKKNVSESALCTGLFYQLYCTQSQILKKNQIALLEWHRQLQQQKTRHLTEEYKT